MVGSHDYVRPSEGDMQSTSTPYPRLSRVLSPAPSAISSLLGLSSPRFKVLPLSSTVEVSPSTFKIARKIGELLASPGESASSGGCALVIDYGGDKAYGDSFRVSTRACPTFNLVLIHYYGRRSKVTKLWTSSISQVNVI